VFTRHVTFFGSFWRRLTLTFDLLNWQLAHRLFMPRGTLCSQTNWNFSTQYCSQV